MGPSRAFAARLASALSVDVIAAILLAVPILLVRSPPMVDFTGHEAVVGVLGHWGDRAYLTGALYRLNFGHPNQLQYLIAWPVSLLLGAAKGLELSVAVSVAAVVIGAGHLAAYLRRPRWTALYAVPVAVGWYFQWGNIANLLGAGTLFVALPSLDRFALSPTLRRVPVACGWCVLLYLAHETAAIIACVAIACVALRSFSPRRAAYCAIPIAFTLALVLVQFWVQRLTPTNEHFFLFDAPLLERLLTIPAVVVGYQDPKAIEYVTFALCMLPPLFARFALRAPEGAPTPEGAKVERARTAPYVVLALLLFGLYCVLPSSYKGVFYFSHRFLPIAWVLGVIVTFRAGAVYPRAYRLAACAVPCAIAFLAFPAFLAADASFRELDSLVGAIEPGSSVATIELDPVERGAVNAQGYSTRMAQGHIVAERGGRSLYDYTQSPISPALMMANKRWDRIVASTFLDPVAIRPRAALTHFRYLVIHSTSPAVGAATARALGGIARIVAVGSSWMIFESQEELIPADAPEGRYPTPAGDTLRDDLVSILSAGSR